MARSGFELRTANGTRVSIQCYLDPTVGVRKQILNSLRSGGGEQPDTIQQTQGSFGSVSSVSPAVAPITEAIARIERSLGMTLSNLRGVLLGRGGNSSGLLLTAARLADVEVVTAEELRDAYYQAYQDICGFIDGRHATCDAGAQKLPPLSEAEKTPDPWASGEAA